MARSLERNTRPSAGKTPYGLDRLYRGSDGKPRILTRWEGRTQIWYRTDAGGNPTEEIGRRVKPPRRKTNEPFDGRRRRQRFKGYVKQDDEESELVAGSLERRAVLVFIFTAYDLWGWGYHRIVNRLNSRGSGAPEGDRWTLKTLRSILYNPIYLGIEVSHRYSAALYYKLSPNGPVPVHVDQDALEREGRLQIPRVERPRDEWQIADKPELKDLLPEDVREVSLQRILRELDPDTPDHPKKGVPIHRGEAARHRHLNSPSVAMEHYLQVTEDHFRRATETDDECRAMNLDIDRLFVEAVAQNAAQSAQDGEELALTDDDNEKPQAPDGSGTCGSSRYKSFYDNDLLIPPRGLEPLLPA